MDEDEIIEERISQTTNIMKKSKEIIKELNKKIKELNYDLKTTRGSEGAFNVKTFMRIDLQNKRYERRQAKEILKNSQEIYDALIRVYGEEYQK